MNRSKLMTGFVLVGVVLLSVAIGGQVFRTDVDAQDSSTIAKGKPKATAPIRASSQTNPEPAFPTFYVDDVIEKLSVAVQELVDQKQVKTSEDLRKHLDRTNFPIKFSSPNNQEVSSADLYRRTTESIFLVAGMTKPSEGEKAWKTAFSTAFAIHEDGILSTSAHVFDHDDIDDGVVVMDSKGRVFPVLEVLAIDRKADTSFFRIGTKGLKPLPLGKEAPPGTPVRVIGHPGDSFYFFSAGHIANYERDDDGAYWLNVTADFGQGSSGGPVMDESGNVVGQVSRTYTLYAGGDSSNRSRHRRSIKVATDVAAKDAEMKKDEPADEESTEKKKADPQMVFKACTPVSAIRALAK